MDEKTQNPYRAPLTADDLHKPPSDEKFHPWWHFAQAHDPDDDLPSMRGILITILLTLLLMAVYWVSGRFPGP